MNDRAYINDLKLVTQPPGTDFEIVNGPDGSSCWHVFEADDILAINAALTANRPLLLRGEPGTGKSQLAWAAAQVLERRMIHSVVDADTRAEDLLWKLDAIERLGQAQLVSVGGSSLDTLQVQHFIKPGPVWQALDPESAADYPKPLASDVANTTSTALASGAVLLVDEIDKADSTLPNALLDAFGNRSFNVPPLNQRVQQTGVPPLLIVTTNEDRQLPGPFMRRCLVHELCYPSETDKPAFIEWYCKRIASTWQQMGGDDGDDVLDTAAAMIHGDRVANPHASPRPGFAEYRDLLAAYTGLKQSASNPQDLLERLSGFVLNKQQD